MATKAGEVRAVMKGVLDALPLIVTDDVQVTLGYPRTPRRTYIFLGETSWEGTQWETNRSRQETFSITVGMETSRERTTANEVEAYLLSLSEGFENALDSDPGMQTAGVITSRFAPRRLRSWQSGSHGYTSQYEVEVVVTCRP